MPQSNHTYWDFDWHDGEFESEDDLDDPDKGRWWQPFMSLPPALFHRVTWGQPITNWPDNIAADSDEDSPIEDMPMAVEAPITSQRTRDLLERIAPGNVQFLPVTMTHRGKPMRIGRYWVMNIVTLVDCLDADPGSFDPLPARVATYMPADKVQIGSSQTRFLRDVVPRDAALFRMKKQYISVIARDDVREAFVANGITGVKFKPLPYQIV